MEQTERWARDFHNLRFADDAGRETQVGKFYSAIDYGFVLYRRRVLDAARDKILLEWGCGNASLGFDAASVAKDVIGIDISEGAIHQAHRIAATRHVPRIRFMIDNAESMRLPDQSVDVLAGNGIIHHLDIPRAMREARRVLRPGGVALYAEPIGHNPVVNWYRKRTPELRTADEHRLAASDLRTMAREFRACRITYFGCIAPILGVFNAQTDPRRMLTKLTWLLDRLLCRVPVLQRYAWFCVIELQA